MDSDGSRVVAQGSLWITVSETTVISLDCCPLASGPRMCSSLPHAVVCGIKGGLLFFFRSFPEVVCRLRLESGYVCDCEGPPDLLKRALRPILLHPRRMSGWTMGRLDTMMATNVSRHAHRLPDMAPSGPD